MKEVLTSDHRRHARETDMPEMFADTEDIAKVSTVRSNNELQLFGIMMTFYSNLLAFNYFTLSQISGADVWYVCDLTCSHNIGRMMVTLYMVLPMANMIPLHTLHMCINGTCNRDARCRCHGNGYPTAVHKSHRLITAFCICEHLLGDF